MGVLLKFQGCFNEVLRLVNENFKGASRKFKECFKEVSGKSQGCLRKVPRVFK